MEGVPSSIAGEGAFIASRAKSLHQVLHSLGRSEALGVGEVTQLVLEAGEHVTQALLALAEHLRERERGGVVLGRLGMGAVEGFDDT